MNRKSTAPSEDEAPASAPRARSVRRSAASEPKRTVEERDAVKPEPAADQPIQPVDPELRHRLISEAAHALYVERGCVDGFAFEDWLTAETQVDNALKRGGAQTPD